MHRSLILSAAAAALAGPLAAPLVAQTPTVRLINAPDASTKPVFGTIVAVRQLPGGQVLVNDIVKRQLSLVDASFSGVSVVADSAGGAPNSYGTRAGGLIAYAADSSLFVDPAELSMFVIDPHGAITRVASVPRSQDASLIGTNLFGTPGIDARGRLVYRAGISRVMPGAGSGGKGLVLADPPDSAALVRIDLATRKLDTAGYYKIPKIKMNVQQTDRGFSATSEINPMPTVDDWTVLADGSVAIVRGQDYHVDFIDADGAPSAGAKIPFDWQRLTDDDKVAVVDSAKAAMDRSRAAAAPSATGAASAPGGLPGGGGMVVMMRSDGGGAPRITAGGPANLPAATFISPSELPDYRPAFSQGAVRADADDNLWVRTSAVRAGTAGFIYDVVNRRGALVDRIQVPPGRQVIGFGKRGVVYMAAFDEHGSWLERTHR